MTQWLADLPPWVHLAATIIGALATLFGAHRIYLTWDE